MVKVAADTAEVGPVRGGYRDRRERGVNRTELLEPFIPATAIRLRFLHGLKIIGNAGIIGIANHCQSFLEKTFPGRGGFFVNMDFYD